MPEKKKNNKKNNIERNFILRIFLFLVNNLILLGYIILFPFEKLIPKLKNSVANLQKLSKKTIVIPTFGSIFTRLKDSVKSYFIWFSAQKSVNEKSRIASERKKKKLAELKKRQRVKKKHARRSRLITVVKYLFIFNCGTIFALLFIATPAFAYYWTLQLPSPENLQEQTQNSSTKILDRNGRLLYEIYIDKKYDPVPLKQIPDDVINATLAIEDAAFYEHPGFDIASILRAAKSTFLENDIQGGSTITQQLIKNVLLSPEQTYIRKVKELVLAVKVENQYSKSEILEFYLNNIPYGGTSYGIQAASKAYFDKNVWDLSLAEASMLAGLPSAPSAYSPLQGNTELAKQRQLQVLNRMVSEGYISRLEASDAYLEELEFARQVDYIRAAHFVNYVRQELYDKYGQRAVDFGGLTVTTTLDLDLQDNVQKILAEEVANNGSKLGFSNSASVVLDSKSGQILAYVGSVDFFAEGDGNFDVVTAYRQPGSSLKPVTYAMALEKGYTASSTIDDSPITYQVSGQKYTPKNYDNRYHGHVTLRQALANSYNIPAVKLINAVGVDDMVQKGRDLGFDNWVVGDGSYGMSIALGGKEVRLLDLANVYATFSRGGEYRNVTPFLSVKDLYGYELLGLIPRTSRQVFSPETSYIITSILSDNSARTPAFGPRSQLYIPNKTVAVKTGTTNDIRDNLTVGYTPTYAVAVWVGNNDNSTMNRNLASGLTGAAPIWNKIMLTLLQDSPDEDFSIPEDILIKEDKSCPNKFEVYDKNKDIPATICSKVRNSKDKDEQKEDN